MVADYKIIGGDGREYGPATLEEIRHWCADGRVAPGTPVWRSDEERWLVASAREELRWDLPQPVAPPPVIEAGPAPFRRAGFLPRLAAFMFDWVIVVCLINFLTLPWSRDRLEKNQRILAELKADRPDLRQAAKDLASLLVVDVSVNFAYFVAFNALRGATPGKRMFGLRIVRLDGGEIGLRKALVRQLMGNLSLCCLLGFGHLLVAFTPERRAVHDLVAGTQVVYLH
jgi:uncharacterized RDD family membrane protein YckC